MSAQLLWEAMIEQAVELSATQKLPDGMVTALVVSPTVLRVPVPSGVRFIRCDIEPMYVGLEMPVEIVDEKVVRTLPEPLRADALYHRHLEPAPEAEMSVDNLKTLVATATPTSTYSRRSLVEFISERHEFKDNVWTGVRVRTPITELEIHRVTDSGDFAEIRRWLGDRRRDVLAIDIETGPLGKDPNYRVDPIRLMQIGDVTGGWSIDFQQYQEFCRDVLRDYTGPVVGHNVRFDVSHLLHAKVKLPPHRQFHDSFIQAHLINCKRPLGLKDISAAIDPLSDVGEDCMKRGKKGRFKNWATVPIDDIAYNTYGVSDTCLSAFRHLENMPQIHALGLDELYAMEMRVMDILRRMQAKGIRIDEDLCRTTLQSMLADQDKATEAFVAEYGCSPSSNQQLVKMMLDDGLQWKGVTPKGVPSIAKDIMDDIILLYPYYPPAQQVLELRKNKKTIEMYQTLSEVAENGRVYTDYQQLGAATGRMSAKRPNTQQIPRGSAAGVRNVFIADEGERLVCCDYATMEVRAYANFAHDELMRDALLTDDFHSANAKRIFRLHDEPSKEQRNRGKALATDTPIPTPFGWTTMGELQVGDEVFGRDGKPTKVLYVSPTYTGHDCYEVSFYDGCVITADADHLWTVFDRNKKDRSEARVINTQELADTWVGDGRGSRYSVPDAGPHEYAALNLPIDPWLLGYWLGDGDTLGAPITVGEQDIDWLRSKMAERGHVIQHEYVDHRGSNKVYRITVQGLYRELRKQFLIGNKHIPIAYLEGSTEQRTSLLHGLMDSDGTVSSREGACSIGFSHERLASDTLALIRTFGIRPVSSSKVPKISGKECRRHYTATFRTTMSVFSIDRKNAVHRPLAKKGGARTVTGVRAVPSVPTVCIGVAAEDSLFLAGIGSIPCHNTLSFALQYGAGARTVAKKFKVQLSMGRELAEAYHSATPRLREYGEELAQTARDNYMETGAYFIRGFGGRMHYVDEDKLYKALAYDVQGGCATIYKQALVRIDDAGLADHALLCIHDEVVSGFPEAEVEEGGREVARLMTAMQDDWLIPLVVDPSEPLVRWGDKK